MKEETKIKLMMLGVVIFTVIFMVVVWKASEWVR